MSRSGSRELPADPASHKLISPFERFGCFRMINPDVISLYEEVPVGTRVIVRQAPKL